MNQTVLSIDVEWAHPEVLAYLLAELDARNLRATFFCTHEGICVNGHERALHPNYRRVGNSAAPEPSALPNDHDPTFYEQITLRTKSFCPEAVGVRGHHLFWDSALAWIYRNLGMRYVSNAFLPLHRELQPVARLKGLLEIPIYYMDHWDISEQVTGFDVRCLRLGQGGLQVLDFHPNLIFINAQSKAHYEATREHYHNPEALRDLRASGRGAGTLFLDVLDYLAARSQGIMTLADIEEQWRNQISA